jgi:hypothetical protein
MGLDAQGKHESRPERSTQQVGTAIGIHDTSLFNTVRRRLTRPSSGERETCSSTNMSEKI